MTDANDRQVGGDHYKQFEIDPWDAIAIFCPKNLVGVEIYLWGCAFKYMVRLGSKGSTLEDLEKAEHYLQKLHQTLEKKLADRVTITEDKTIGTQGPTPSPPPKSKPEISTLVVRGSLPMEEEKMEAVSTPDLEPQHGYGYTPMAYKRSDRAPPPGPPSRD